MMMMMMGGGTTAMVDCGCGDGNDDIVGLVQPTATVSITFFHVF